MIKFKILLQLRIWILLWLAFISLRHIFVYGAEEIATTQNPLHWDELEKKYEETGMNYARKLYLKQNGSEEDDKRTKKSDLLNYSIRKKTILRTQNLLEKTKNKKLKQELLRRMATLHEQQAENINRQTLSNKEEIYKNHIKAAISWLKKLQKFSPHWNADYAFFSLAENHVKIKNYAAAEKNYRYLIQKTKQSSLLADALLALGNLYFEKQAFSLARYNYKQILNTQEVKLHAYAHYKIAWCFFNESNPEAAILSLENTIFSSRKLQTQLENKKLGVEDEALNDLVLFYAEYANPKAAKQYFSKIVAEEKNRDLRFILVKRYYEHGQHFNAKTIAEELLTEDVSHEQKNKLYLILISVAEKLKDRSLSLEIAKKFGDWIKNKNDSQKIDLIESEEYMRLYAQRLHYEAETLKKQTLWEQAAKAYEIYLKTFTNENETNETRYRYAVLLMNQKKFISAYEQTAILLSQMSMDHKRHKDTLKLQIQSLELAKEKDKNETLLAAYDAFTKNYPTDSLSIEALYKAAQLAKILESPLQTAKRFRFIAEKYPSEKIAHTAMNESLTTLIKAEKWEELQNESSEWQKIAQENVSQEKILETKELAMLKIAEKWEKDKKIMEAMAAYESYVNSNTSDTFKRFSLGKLAELSEKELKNFRASIKYWKKIQTLYPNSKEGIQAYLELARLHEIILDPYPAIQNYLSYLEKKPDEIAPLTNAAIILESLGEREKASKLFMNIHERLGTKKDSWKALEAACNNTLLLLAKNSNKNTYENLASCSEKMLAHNPNSILWQTRKAWALERGGDLVNSQKTWMKLAKMKMESAPTDIEKSYLIEAKLHTLVFHLENFQKLKFSTTNEKPEVNITKKSNALDQLEQEAGKILKLSSSKQIVKVQKILEEAYLDFAVTMENAALPKKLNEKEHNDMKNSFLVFANEMKNRAKEISEKQKNILASLNDERKLASVSNNVADSYAVPKINNNDMKLWEEKGGITKDANILAQLSYKKYHEGSYNEARYIAQKWKNELNKSLNVSGTMATEKAYANFVLVLERVIPSTDIMNADLF